MVHGTNQASAQYNQKEKGLKALQTMEKCSIVYSCAAIKNGDLAFLLCSVCFFFWGCF